MQIREIVTNAIRYWELARVLYNAILLLVVAAAFVWLLPTSREQLSLDMAQSISIYAVLANLAYCAAYPVDLLAQCFALRATWLRYRWILFVIGTMFASLLALAASALLFSEPIGPD
jgi:hypothetical protein